MPILPVWIDSWQMGCCGEDNVAEVGQNWLQTLLMRVETYVQTEEQNLGWSMLDLGMIRFVARVLNSDEPLRAAQPILDLGVCQVGAGSEAIRAGGTISGTGRVYADWHVGFDDPARR